MAFVYACLMAMVLACIMATARACTIATVRACIMAKVHALMMTIIRWPDCMYQTQQGLHSFAAEMGFQGRRHLKKARGDAPSRRQFQ